MKPKPDIFTQLLFLVFLFAIPGPAQAQDSSVGCGLGTYVITDNRTLVSATARFSLNWLFFNQLFGVSSGTSGCGRYRLVQQQRMWQQRYFLALQTDITQALVEGNLQHESLRAFPLTQSCQHYWQHPSNREWQSLGAQLITASSDQAWEIFEAHLLRPCIELESKA